MTYYLVEFMIVWEEILECEYTEDRYLGQREATGWHRILFYNEEKLI